MANIAILGAGIIGLCTAENLRRKGLSVTLFDPLPPGTGATYGNGGMISAAAMTPMALPGMLLKIPKWLRDPEGPLFVDPKYFSAALPWLIRWVGASAMSKVHQAANALYQLHAGAITEYRALLGSAAFDASIKVVGQVHVWDSEEKGKSERIIAQLREVFGIKTETLSSQRLREMLPDLNPAVAHGLYFPDNGHTVNPLRLAQAIYDDFMRAGGQAKREKVLRIFPYEGRYRLWTHCGDHTFDQVVVAGGAWSLELLKPLGLSIPLETERGYHIQIPDPNVGLAYPVLHKGRGFGGSTMQDGLRLGGTVEIAGLDAPPNPRRIQAILNHAKALLPRLELSDYKAWMGFRPSTPDSLPVLSESVRHPGLYIACGHGHLGITGGAASGRLMAEIMTRSPTFIDPTPYRLERF